MSEQTQEKLILTASKNLFDIGEAADRLIADLGKGLAKTKPHFVEVGSNCWRGNDWSAPAWWIAFKKPGARARKKKLRPGAPELTVVIDLGVAGGPACGLGRPCVTVGWSGGGTSWSDDLAEEEGKSGAEARSAIWPIDRQNDLVVRGKLAILWDEEEARAAGPDWRPSESDAWFFIVPLSAIRKKSDAHRLIVNPAMALLEGRSPNQAFVAAEEVLDLEALAKTTKSRPRSGRK